MFLTYQQLLEPSVRSSGSFGPIFRDAIVVVGQRTAPRTAPCSPICCTPNARHNVNIDKSSQAAGEQAYAPLLRTWRVDVRACVRVRVSSPSGGGGGQVDEGHNVPAAAREAGTLRLDAATVTWVWAMGWG